MVIEPTPSSSTVRWSSSRIIANTAKAAAKIRKRPSVPLRRETTLSGYLCTDRVVCCFGWKRWSREVGSPERHRAGPGLRPQWGDGRLATQNPCARLHSNR